MSVVKYDDLIALVRKMKPLDSEKVECVVEDRKMTIKVFKKFNKTDFKNLSVEYLKCVTDADAMAINIDNYFKFVTDVCLKYKKHYRITGISYNVDASDVSEQLLQFRMFKKIIELAFDGEFFDIESMYESKKPIA